MKPNNKPKEGEMNTKKPTLKAFKIGQAVKWKSGAAGIVKAKKGIILAKIAAGKAIPVKKFPTLANRATGKTNSVRFVVDVKGKLYCPRTTLLQTV